MSLPLVSVILPVRGRPLLAAMAVACYLAQDYPLLELITIDDGDPFLDDLFEHLPRPTAGTYVRLHPGGNMPLGRKRNLACELAHGELIALMDSDDWAAHDRISSQVRAMITSGQQVTGYHSLHFYDLLSHHAHLYHLSDRYVCGASLMFTRDCWMRHPFLEVDRGEDTPFTIDHPSERCSEDGRGRMVCLLHDDNLSSRRQLQAHPGLFPEISVSSLPDGFFRAIGDIMESDPGMEYTAAARN